MKGSTIYSEHATRNVTRNLLIAKISLFLILYYVPDCYAVELRVH